MDKPNLSESLGRMAELEARLKELGVPPDAIGSVMGHIDEYVELRDGLDQARNKQFHGDAWGFMGDIKQASGKNVDALSAFLRKFAEHVADNTISLTQIHGGDASMVVDHISPMAQEEE